MPDIFDYIEPQIKAEQAGEQYRRAKQQGDIFDQIAIEVPRRGSAQIPQAESGPQFGPARALEATSSALNPVDLMFKVLQGINAPFQYASRKVEENIGEPVRRSLQEDFGLSPEMSAGIATGLTLPARGMIEILGPAKAIQLGTSGISRSAQALGERLSRTPNVAFGRRQAAIQRVQTPEGEPGPLVQALKSPTPSSTLYEEIGEANPVIPLRELKPILNQIQKEEALAAGTGLEHPQTTRLVSELDKKFFKQTIKSETSPLLDEFGKPITREIIAGGKGEAEFQQARLLMKRLNERIGRLKTEGGEEFGDALQVKKGFIKSLDVAAEGEAGPAWEKLRAANKAFKQELGYDKVSEIIGRKVKMLEGRPEAEAQNIAAGQAFKEIRQFFKDEPDIARAMPPGSVTRLQNGLERLRQLPLFPAPSGVSAGSQNIMGKIFMSSGIGGTAGAAVGGAMAGPPGGVVGGALGAVTYYKLGDVISRALGKPGGIQLVEKLMRSNTGSAGFTPDQIAVLGTFIRGSVEAQ